MFFTWIALTIPGWSWIWAFRSFFSKETSQLKRLTLSGLLTYLVGIFSLSLGTLLLAEFGQYTNLAGIILFLLIVITGILTGLRHAKEHRALIRQALPVSLLMLIAIVVIFAYPNRGEWILGGWDPGVYVNESMAIERSGSLYPDDSFFYELLTEEEQDIFTRTGKNRTERFPGILVHPENKSTTFQFFRLTPCLFASFARLGGIQAVSRANTILGVLAVLSVSVLCLHCFNARTAAGASLLLLASPVFLFYSHLPTTEMLQLFFILSLCLFVFQRLQTRTSLILIFLCTVGAVLNRFSSLPFIGILTLTSAVHDNVDDARKDKLPRRTVLIAGTVLGAILDIQISPVSLFGWSALPLILGVWAGASLLALCIDLCSKHFPGFEINKSCAGFAWPAFCILFLIGVGTSWFLREYFFGKNDADNLIRLFPFTGITPLATAGIGLLGIFIFRKRFSTASIAILIFYFVTSWLLILNKQITDLYPWALRRYVPYLLPFVALSCAALLDQIWNISKLRPAGPSAALCLLAILVLLPGRAADRAWRYTEYNGMTQAIQSIAEQVKTNDLIVADHPWWGTPLAMIHGVQVLNGKRLWSDKSGERMNVAESAFARLCTEGKRVRFLTSTGDGLNIYPFDSNHIEPDWTSDEVVFQEIIQHPRADGFELRTKKKTFRLYSYCESAMSN